MKPAKQAHPRLYFCAEDLPLLREKRGIDSTARAIWDRVLRKAEKALEQPLPRWSKEWEFAQGVVGVKNLGNLVTESAASELCLAYLLEGEDRYARKAKEVVLAFCDFDFWIHPFFFRPPRYDPPWRGWIDTAGVCRVAAWVYDWLYDYLTETERERIRFCLAYKGILPIVQDWADPATRLPVATHLKPWGSAWASCSSGAGTAAFALLGEDDQAERWIRLVKKTVLATFSFKGWVVPKLRKKLSWVPEGTCFPPNYDSEGGYWQGIGYLGTLRNVFQFSEPYLRMTGKEMLPLNLMRKVSNFILYLAYRERGRMRAANFDDVRANHFTSTLLTSFLARKLRHSGLQWHLASSRSNFEEPSWDAYEEMPGFTFLWYDPSIEPEEPKAADPVKVFPTGWAVMRTGWGPEDTTFIMKCGATAGHAHADAGTFILNHRDESLVIDSGVSSYLIPEYEGYYKASRAHNVVLVGDQGQSKRLAGRIEDRVGVPGYALVVADATAPYEGILKRFVRRVLFLGGKYYVLVDELRKATGDPLQWLLHFEGELARDDRSFLIRNGESRLLVRIVSPGRLSCHMEQGFKATHDDETVIKTVDEKRAELIRSEYLVVRPEEDRPEQTFLSVLFPASTREALPDLEELSDNIWVGFRLRRGAFVDTVGARITGTGAGASKGLEGIETDARLFAVTRDGRGAITRALLENGRSLRAGGRACFVSSVPCAAALQFEEEIEMALEAKERASIDLESLFTPKRVFLDGKAFPDFRHDASTGMIHLSVDAGRHSAHVQAGMMTTGRS